MKEYLQKFKAKVIFHTFFEQFSIIVAICLKIQSNLTYSVHVYTRFGLGSSSQ